MGELVSGFIGERWQHRLTRGIGGRWWIDCVLHELNKFFTEGYHESRMRDDIKIWLRLTWDEKGLPVYPGEIQTLRKGIWLEMEHGGHHLSGHWKLNEAEGSK